MEWHDTLNEKENLKSNSRLLLFNRFTLSALDVYDFCFRQKKPFERWMQFKYEKKRRRRNITLKLTRRNDSKMPIKSNKTRNFFFLWLEFQLSDRTTENRLTTLLMNELYFVSFQSSIQTINRFMKSIKCYSILMIVRFIYADLIRA